MQPITDYSNTTMNKDMVLIHIDISDVGVINETNDSRYRNRGRVISLSQEAASLGIKVGDMVHFGDIAGKFPFKNKDRNIYVLHKDEIVMISDDEKIFLGEDLSFYAIQDFAAYSNDRIARI